MCGVTDRPYSDIDRAGKQRLFYLRSPVRFEGGCATSESDADDTCVIRRLAEGRFACALDLECGARYAPVSE